MKILKVEFRNINSLKGDHEIDFTKAPFTVSSLFAITGPTGSGKTTILDVISLALFNNIPRLTKVSKGEILKTGAILTRNQTDAMAAVTYEGRKGKFRSQWSISTARTGSLREYEMELSNADSGELIDLKKSEVPGKNEELIGLNYNQFNKSVLLAQGEFAQFLKAKKDERGELLEKITGTGIYRQLGRKAYEKNKLVSQEIQKQQETIAIIKEELLEEEKVKELAERLNSRESGCKPLEEEIQKLGKNLELKTLISNQKKEIKHLHSEKGSIEKNFKVFEAEHGHELNQHEKVRDFAEEIRHWSRLQKECAVLKQDLDLKNARKEKNLLELKDCLKDVNNLTKVETSQENLESHLQEFSGKVQKLQKAVDEKLVEYKGLQLEFQMETRELTCNLNEKDPEATRKQLEEMKISSKEKIRQIVPLLKDVDLQNVETEKKRLRNCSNDAQEARNQSNKIDHTSAEIKKIKLQEERLLPLIQQFPKEIEGFEDKMKLYRERLEKINLQKQNQLLLASLEEQRGFLKEGDPCPLCGSIHHPFATELPEGNDEVEKELEETKKNFNEWNQKVHAGHTTLNHYKKELLEVTSNKQLLEKDLETQHQAFLSHYKYLITTEETDWKNICEDYQSKLETLERYEKEKRSLHCVEVALPLVKQLMEAINEGKILREDLRSIYAGEDIQRDTQKLQTRWTQLRQFEKAIGEQIEEYREKLKVSGEKLEKLEGELTEKVIQKGFLNIAEAEKILLPDSHYFSLLKNRDNLEKEIARISQSLKIISSQLEESKKNDVENSAEELTELRRTKTKDLDQMREECLQIKRHLVNDRERRERLKILKAEIAEKEKQIKRWRLLNELIGDATGKKFNDFAQDLSLSQLLILANKRLGALSDRYKIDKPTGEEDDGLVAIDEHMGGQRRSVKTLSGGETFILSLSMALALSDLASRNVEINSLFIDEGFGTLDPETLDQTLDTLEKLQAESSKTIGIISHVESLKERIATQIQLTRNGQGYSSLLVKG